MQSKFKETYSQFQMPLEQLVQLGLRSMRDFSYLKPEELLRLRKPQDWFEKQIDIFVANGHKALDYFQEAAVILEKNWFSATAGMEENFTRSMRESALWQNKQKTNPN